MAQGTLKKNPKPGFGSNAGASPAGSRRPKSLGPRPGKKVIAPKKTELVKQQKLKKKVTAGLITATERTLAQKAGHLELLKGGKKDRREVAAAEVARAKGGK
ncbi:hypothetical protein BDZ91DRAFT_847804 [Kalaharituber pfeilii]|nr:hypothetical protein BDZ91DRAFT_847804 [Kalaharituber pfeilii]